MFIHRTNSNSNSNTPQKKKKKKKKKKENIKKNSRMRNRRRKRGIRILTDEEPLLDAALELGGRRPLQAGELAGAVGRVLGGEEDAARAAVGRRQRRYGLRLVLGEGRPRVEGLGVAALGIREEPRERHFEEGCHFFRPLSG